MSSRAPPMPSFIGFDRPLLSTTRSIPPPLSGFASSSDAFILITLIKGNLPPIQRKGRARSGRTDKRARQAERDAPAVRFRPTTVRLRPRPDQASDGLQSVQTAPLARFVTPFASTTLAPGQVPAASLGRWE